jgi:hypothetical protein
LGWFDWKAEFEKLQKQKEERMAKDPNWKPVPPNPHVS